MGFTLSVCAGVCVCACVCECVRVCVRVIHQAPAVLFLLHVVVAMMSFR